MRTENVPDTLGRPVSLLYETTGFAKQCSGKKGNRQLDKENKPGHTGVALMPRVSSVRESQVLG
jgi:hypothetical protein